MKNKEQYKARIKSPGLSDRIETGELASDNDMAQISAALQFAKEHKDSIVFTKKYIAGQKRLTSWKLEKLKKEEPAISLKDAVSTILGELPEMVTSDMLLEITRHLISEWEKKPAGRKSETT